MGGRSFEEFNVKHRGAVGDGKTDDYESIQKFIAEQTIQGKVILYFPPGTYKVSKTIKISGKGFDGKLLFLVRGAGVKQTEIFVTDKNMDTLYIEGGREALFARGVLSHLAFGPERNHTVKSWPLHLNRIENSDFKNFSTRGSRCSVRDSNGKGNHFGAMQVGEQAPSGAHRSVCIGLQ